MKISTFFSVAAVLCAALLFNGCAGSKSPAAPAKAPKPKEKVQPPVISSASCALTVPREIRAIAGTPLDVEIQLIYSGNNELLIREWYMLDRNNFSVFYRQLPSDRVAAKGVPFKKYSPLATAKTRQKQTPLTLKPGNRAMLTVTLPFTGDLAPGEKAAYEVYIATTLVTFKIKSNLFTVYTY